ncbi:transglycosylase SLT domain-containing protein [Sulfitobacter noctilucae]|uniref:transglycosylase SLT domain-containing protein n=1 Tax=Sulfitobacter noctilucae TaxID=1342302 RepID=UPI001F4C6D80|nr:transglycosylase SLT domain-containing protein [Sulfitobacter noctilucae]
MQNGSTRLHNLSMKILALFCGLSVVWAGSGLHAEEPLRPQPRAVSLDTVQAGGTSEAPAALGTGEARINAAQAVFTTALRPPARRGNLPRTRWQHMSGHALWTRAALAALKDHGQPLVNLVPADVTDWCPKYPQADDAERRAFWVGFLSALAKHESTYKPWAVGGGGKWYGLLQILPSTARGYKCNVGTGEALKNGAANLSCAVRIMAHTVPRDGVIHGYKGRRGQGVTADWGPMHSSAKRRDMARWLKRQTYCKPINATRPKGRP